MCERYCTRRWRCSVLQYHRCSPSICLMFDDRNKREMPQNTHFINRKGIRQFRRNPSHRIHFNESVSPKDNSPKCHITESHLTEMPLCRSPFHRRDLLPKYLFAERTFYRKSIFLSLFVFTHE